MPGTEIANMSSAIHSEGGKRNVYQIPLVFQVPVLGGSFLYSFIHLLIYTFIDLLFKNLLITSNVSDTEDTKMNKTVSSLR